MKSGPFRCQRCLKCLTTQHNLIRHIREVHEDQRHRCPSCSKSYKRPTSLKNHQASCHPCRPQPLIRPEDRRAAPKGNRPGPSHHLTSLRTPPTMETGRGAILRRALEVDHIHLVATRGWVGGEIHAINKKDDLPRDARTHVERPPHPQKHSETGAF